MAAQATQIVIVLAARWLLDYSLSPGCGLDFGHIISLSRYKGPWISTQTTAAAEQWIHIWPQSAVQALVSP